VLPGGSRGEVDEARRSVDLDAVPEATGHDEGVAGAEGVVLDVAGHLDRGGHLPRYQVDQLVAVGVALAEVRR
jgi:hypothetical protein